ncbi:proteolytic subunit of ATP-dependent Clp protease [Chloropicon primus]|uniref:ATP-dependent Clp protease proteolytic subunit n=1 Tax=Chloropicon primus TaxID=1764295 RepID=A0A5B8MTA6_9CHLO|nr:proteolytic subunit of ATP-dependent Clp protease [Chloropicon primus]UPR02769.1 proteolytic subunit of ATP-dependent Clp protease [Chloropicon primus]|eukprot:QDZ23557.1 proteolytic subunit of ATP-dependent Clp protease [Chloropicon primus]
MALGMSLKGRRPPSRGVREEGATQTLLRPALSGQTRWTRLRSGKEHQHGFGLPCASKERCVRTRVIPSLIGDAATQPPPDLPSFLFKERIVYLGMTLVPSVTELLVAQFLYLQFEDPQKPIYFYINSTGTTKEDDRLAYDAEAFAILDTLNYIKNPVYTVCVGTAWGEAAMLLAAGEKGHRAALPSSTIMIKEPVALKRGQASDLDLARLELREVRDEVVKTLAKYTERTVEQVSEDIRRPVYMKPERAIEYGLIDKILEESALQ